MRTATREERLDIETVVGGILIVGLSASIACIVAGLAWYRAVNGSFRLEYALPATGVGQFLVVDARTITSLHAGPRRLVDLGIGILMLTPYVRVLASMACFLAARNWKYAGFTATVLVTLTYALFH